MGKQSLFDLYLKRFQKFYFTYRTIPSFATCMEILEVNSKSVVHRFFQQMIDNGYLVKRQGMYYPGERLVSFPFFESVRAGFPSPATDELKDQISIESYLIDHPTTTILIKVQGDSMLNAGLYEGDIIVVDKAKKEKIGDVVVAVVDGEYTLKFLQKDKKGKFYLEPANPAYENIYPERELEIFGVVVGSLRKY